MLAGCVFAVMVGFIWGRIDPEVSGISVLIAALAVGIVSYLYASGRRSTLATFCICIGIAGLAFWGSMVASGSLPVARGDVPWVTMIFAFPLATLGLGFYMRRRVRRGAEVREA